MPTDFFSFVSRRQQDKRNASNYTTTAEDILFRIFISSPMYKVQRL